MEVVCIPLVSALRKNDGNNESVKTESFSEDQDKDHTNEDVFLGVGADTSVTDNTNGEASSQGGETDAQAGSEEFVSIGGWEWAACTGGAGSSDGTVKNDTDNKTVDTENTSHNNGDEGLVNKLGLEDTDGADTNTGLGSTVSGTQVYKMSQKLVYLEI